MGRRMDRSFVIVGAISTGGFLPGGGSDRAGVADDEEVGWGRRRCLHS